MNYFVVLSLSLIWVHSLLYYLILYLVFLFLFFLFLFLFYKISCPHKSNLFPRLEGFSGRSWEILETYSFEMENEWPRCGKKFWKFVLFLKRALHNFL